MPILTATEVKASPDPNAQQDQHVQEPDPGRYRDGDRDQDQNRYRDRDRDQDRGQSREQNRDQDREQNREQDQSNRNATTLKGKHYVVVIPARMASTRLPGKPLIPIAGRPLIAHVIARAQESQAVRVIVASDTEAILDVARRCGAEAYWTPETLASGTDRIAYLAEMQGWDENLCVVNLQGDEPLTPGPVLDTLAALLLEHPAADMATLGVPIQSITEWRNPNVVKLVTDAVGRALYFSRAPIPWDRDALAANDAPDLSLARRHLGLYAYRAGFLRRLAEQPPDPLEQLERLEQLRALGLGAWIQVGELKNVLPAGVDTPEDVERVERLLSGSMLV